MQKNFELIKDKLWGYICSIDKFQQIPLYDTIREIRLLPKAYPARWKDITKELDSYISRMDIRQVPKLIEILKDPLNKDFRVPQWMYDGQFIIDYNDGMELDLIRIKNY